MSTALSTIPYPTGLSRMWLAAGDAYLNDAVQLDDRTNGAWIPFDGDIKHDTDGKVTFDIWVVGNTFDEVLRRWAQIESYLLRAGKAATPYRHALPIVLIEQTRDASEWTYRDVLDGGTVVHKPTPAVSTGRAQIRATVTVPCAMLGRGTPIFQGYGSTTSMSGGGSSLHVMATPGTAEALCEVRIKDIGGGIAKVIIGQRSDLVLDPTSTPTFIPASGSLTTQAAWQRLFTGTVQGRGLYDVFASITDAGLVLTAPRIDSLINASGGELPPGATFQYIVTPYDAGHNYGTPSRIATVATPFGLQGPTDMQYFSWESFDTGNILNLYPGPTGFGVTIIPEAAYSGGYGCRIDAASRLSEGAPKFPTDSETLSVQAQIRYWLAAPYAFDCKYWYSPAAAMSKTTSTSTSNSTGDSTSNSTSNSTSSSSSTSTSQSMSHSDSSSTSTSKSESTSQSNSKSDSDSTSSSDSTSTSHSHSTSESQSKSHSHSTSTSNSKSHSHSQSTSDSDSHSTSDSDSDSSSDSKSDSESDSDSTSDSDSDSDSSTPSSHSHSHSSSTSHSHSNSSTPSSHSHSTGGSGTTTQSAGSFSTSSSISDSDSTSSSLSLSDSDSTSDSDSDSSSSSTSHSHSHSQSNSHSHSNSTSHSHSTSQSHSHSTSQSHSTSNSDSDSTSSSDSTSDSNSDSDSQSESTSDSDSDSNSHSDSKSHSESTSQSYSTSKSSSDSSSQSDSNSNSSSSSQSNSTSSSTSNSTSHSTSTSTSNSTSISTSKTVYFETFGFVFLSPTTGYVAVLHDDGTTSQLSNTITVTSDFHLAEITVKKTQSGASFRFMLDKQMIAGWTRENVTMIDFGQAGVDCDNVCIANNYIGAGLMAGGSEDTLTWEPSRNAAGYVISWQWDDSPWRSLDVGNVLSYTHMNPQPTNSFITVDIPQVEAPDVDYTQFRVSLGGGSASMRLTPVKTVRNTVAGDVPELLYLGTLPLPPGGSAELAFDDVPQTTVAIDARMGSTMPSSVSIGGLWLFPVDQPDSWQQITAKAQGLAGQALEWRIGTDRWGHSYARLYNVTTGAFVGFADVSGALGCGPGETWFTLCVEREGVLNNFIPDQALSYQVAIQRIPRWKYLHVPGGGF